ncbi:MAG: sigma-70 family RNA polymerase sigma factor [Solibacillus sp.]|uniref:RNA polymerase sigma factor n=1 Tax=Solibacillus sp. TaxID=1909654 RepID=UPI0033147C25
MEQLAQIYREIQPKLFAFFYIKTSNSTTAEDLTQDVFFEAAKSIHTYRGDSSLATWLFSIANHLLKKYYRSKKYEKSLLEKLGKKPSSVFHSTEQLVEWKLEAKKLLEKIQLLEPPVKDIMLLRLLGELQFSEIGQLIGKSENYVRVTFHRQKMKLQREEE